MDHSTHSFFDQNGFMPHGHCYLWKPGLLWTHLLSDLLIGLSYVLIAFLLYSLVRRIRLPFGPVFIAFGIFIAACGLTHFMEIWTLWNPDYWASGFVKIITAGASLATALALIPLRPKVIAFANAAQISEERKIKLEAAHRELELLYEKVKESDLLKTQFFANVSHELRTPLALILGPAEEILREGHISAQQSKNLDVILRNSKTLLKQVNDLLDISKIEAGRMKPSYAKTDLVTLFRFVVAHFETVMQSRHIFFTLHAPNSIAAEVDPEKMQRIYMNLLSNAVKFVPDGGRIRVSIQADADNGVFTIEDTGPGIAPELRSLIFERFRQGDEGANRAVGGTGLGLAIVKDFIEMHRGTIKILNGDSHGTTFVMTVPLKAPSDAKVDAGHSQIGGGFTRLHLEGTVQEIRPNPQDNLPAVPKTNQPLVLICEDNPDMNRFIAETLSTEFNVLRAIDGRDGLEKAKQASPDLIVSDIMMPYMSGDQLVHELKKDDRLLKIPILLLSARADDEMRIRLLREGASDYLVKPFAAEELKARALNLVSLKTARDILEKEVSGKSETLVDLAREVGARKREAEMAFEIAKSAREEAERASEVKGAFLSLVSHELSTPLMAMNLTIQLLQKKGRENLDAQQREMVDRLAGSSKQLKSLVEGLLEYVRSGHKDSLSLAPVDLKKLIDDAIEDFKVMAHDKKLELKASLDRHLAPIQSDAMKLRVVLNNLIVNALKFTEKGAVEIRAESGERSTIITVHDTGPGIPKENQTRIFEPFERLEPLEKKTIPGMGLGLALVKQLVEALGGQVRIQSEKGHGSEFIVELPQG